MADRTTHVTYCRICSPLCGLVVEVEEGEVVAVRGDRDHPLTRGFTCPKGRRIGEFHNDPDRLLTSLARGPGGDLVPIDVDDAVAAIASQLGSIVARHGPDSVGLFAGTQTLTASLTHGFMSAWFRALGSRKRFTTMTIDQSAKMVTTGRLGRWAGGRQRFGDADVWMLVGTNPLVSMQGGELTGFPVHDNLRALQEHRRRGLRLIVADPRRTETASHADIHLQLRPGTDAALMAGIHHVLWRDDLIDAEFCDRWVEGLPALRRAVSAATPEAVGAICGLDPDQIVSAARMFGEAQRGMATSGTGPDMGPHANVAQHLIGSLNVVCGRFPREGEIAAGSAVLRGGGAFRAQALSPTRFWEHSPPSRLGPSWMPDELMSPLLPAEILEDGPDRIRALVVAGGNPVAAFPDQDRIIEALEHLELLVVIDPYLTETSRLAHYVIAPTLALERAEDTRGYEHLSDVPFAQHTPPVLAPPPGVVDDWAFFFDLASAMGLTLSMGRLHFEPGSPRPTDIEILTTRAAGGRVDYDELRRHPHGLIVDDAAPLVVEPAPPDAAGRFEVMPDDVASELATAMAALSGPTSSTRPYRLVVRRVKETMNSLGRRLPGLSPTPYNPCQVHPDDLARLGLGPGATARIVSDHGSIVAVVEPDESLRPGTVSMTHCFGGMPGLEDDPLEFGANPNRLLRIDEDLQPISLMPHMTDIPVDLEPIG